ncbi:MAG: hypothetical protein ACR2N2_01890 [Acidimicrobiia bacterium]
MRRRFILIVLGVVAFVAAGCSSSDGADTTTTEAAPVTTITLGSTTTTTGASTTTLAPINQLSAPEYQIVQRIESDSGGDEVVALLDPDSYGTLTDLDLFDLIAEITEQFPPVTTLHVVDDPAAANVVADPDASEEARAVLNEHYFARLDNGFRITYLGPFASSGTVVLGS